MCVFFVSLGDVTSQGHYSEKNCCELVRKMLLAVKHCHVHGLCHRDLKVGYGTTVMVEYGTKWYKLLGRSCATDTVFLGRQRNGVEE